MKKLKAFTIPIIFGGILFLLLWASNPMRIMKKTNAKAFVTVKMEMPSGKTIIKTYNVSGRAFPGDLIYIGYYRGGDLHIDNNQIWSGFDIQTNIKPESATAKLWFKGL